MLEMWRKGRPARAGSSFSKRWDAVLWKIEIAAPKPGCSFLIAWKKCEMTVRFVIYTCVLPSCSLITDFILHVRLRYISLGSLVPADGGVCQPWCWLAVRGAGRAVPRPLATKPPQCFCAPAVLSGQATVPVSHSLILLPPCCKPYEWKREHPSCFWSQLGGGEIHAGAVCPAVCVREMQLLQFARETSTCAEWCVQCPYPYWSTVLLQRSHFLACTLYMRVSLKVLGLARREKEDWRLCFCLIWDLLFPQSLSAQQDEKPGLSVRFIWSQLMEEQADKGQLFHLLT